MSTLAMSSTQHAFHALPEITANALTPSALTQHALEHLRTLNAELAENTHLASDPVRTIIEANAYQAWVLLQRITRTQKSLLITTAQADELDRLGAEYELTRNQGESDYLFRLRIRERMTSSSVAGTAWHYRQRVLDINPALANQYGFKHNAIINVHVGSSKGGQVDIGVLINPHYREFQGAILEAALARANADEVRAICDRINVYPAIAKTVAIKARIIANHSDLAHINAHDYLMPTAKDLEDIQLKQSLDLRDKITAQLKAGFMDYELANLNQTLTRYKLENIMKVEGLYDIEFDSPQERVETEQDEYLILGKVELEIVPRNRR